MKITTKVTREVEVELPMYRRSETMGEITAYYCVSERGFVTTLTKVKANNCLRWSIECRKIDLETEVQQYITCNEISSIQWDARVTEFKKFTRTLTDEKE